MYSPLEWIIHYMYTHLWADTVCAGEVKTNHICDHES
jgi:hypothetical protein